MSIGDNFEFISSPLDDRLIELNPRNMLNATNSRGRFSTLVVLNGMESIPLDILDKSSSQFHKTHFGSDTLEVISSMDGQSVSLTQGEPKFERRGRIGFRKCTKCRDCKKKVDKQAPNVIDSIVHLRE